MSTPSTKAPSQHPKRSIAWWAAHAARVLLALPFILAGLNGFLNFLPAPPPDQLPAFADAMMKTGYMMQLVAGTQLLCGVLLLCNRFVPLALVLLAPVVVNILAFHIFLDRKGLPIAIFITALHLFLLCSYRAAYRPLFAAKARPASAA